MDQKWYVAYVHHGRELKVRDRLQALGVEHFVPTQKVPGSRHKVVERPLANCLAFIRATKDEALDLIHNRGIQADYRTDCATRTLMVVPDKEMDDFRRVFDLSAATGDVTTAPPEVGAAVRVARGPLTGVVGHVSGYRGRVHVVVSLMDLLYATAEVPATWLEPLG